MFDDAFSVFARTILRLIQPVALVWLGLAFLTLALWFKRQRAFAGAAGVLLLLVQVVGGTNFSILLLEQLERPYAGTRLQDLPECDAIVMLGGAVEPSLHEVGNLHLTAAGDRLIMALELARLRKAPVLCVSGGHAKFGRRRWVEADMIKQALDERALPGIPVISFGQRRDTHDEAVHARRLATEHGWKRILLVTSAVHMRRAHGCFRAEGLEAIPAPCNFLTAMSPDAAPPIFGIPTFIGFTFVSTWLHERIGWLEYRRRGWIGSAAGAFGRGSG